MAKSVTPQVRRHLVLEILNSQSISSQDDLVHALAERGVDVTQTTASRDLESVGAIRARDAQGNMRYLAPEFLAHIAIPRQASGTLVLDVLSSGNLAVVKTPPGGAQLLAGELDAAISSGRLPTAIGTIAGDDTVFVVSRTADGGEDLASDIWEFSGGREPKPIKSAL